MPQQHAATFEKMQGAGRSLLIYRYRCAVTKWPLELYFLPTKRAYTSCRNIAAGSREKISPAFWMPAVIGSENRRHKSPRALEHAAFTFEIVADFGVYRDLHRHRMLTQERQLFPADYGYYIPAEIKGTEMEKDYHRGDGAGQKSL